MLEKEVKIILTQNDYTMIKSLCSNINLKNIIQINYYFDTETFIFDSKDITIRIRQANMYYVLNIKIKDLCLSNNQIKVSREFKYNLDFNDFTGLVNGCMNITEKYRNNIHFY